MRNVFVTCIFSKIGSKINIYRSIACLNK